MAYTQRLAILHAYKTLFSNCREPEFSTVEIGPLTDVDGRRRFSIGIIAGREAKNDLFPFKECKFPIDFEFRATINKGDPRPAVLGEMLMGDIQNIIMAADNLGGLIVLQEEVSNELNTFSYSDKSVEGVVQFVVTYRHSHQTVSVG